ncbi:MAG: DUF1800 domain-containing protein [Acidobacteriota bacterium]|nr:DUF1800 domain-containing protein [Acidobacteriota bacterium]
MEPNESPRVLSRRDLYRRMTLRALDEEPKSARRGGSVSTFGRATAMRSPSSGRSNAMTKSVEAPPSAAVIALNRMGFGPGPGSMAVFNALGANDQDRLLAYVTQQVNPDVIDDSACDARISAAGFTTLEMGQAQLWQDHVESGVDWSERMRPFFEIERLTFLRAVHSQRQLLEVLADFWHNHFNVYGYDYWCGPLWVHYDRDVIRANIFGNFRQMLRKSAKSPCMLYYLDNYTSSNAGPNENYARELVELHTLGAENYLGVMRQTDVPLDGQGYPTGYVDDDVFEITRCLTGWTFDFDTGVFEYRGDWHDKWQKNVLATFIPANQSDLQDGNDVLDALAYHPGTARHIAGKLCRRLISDNPPQNVVDAAATVFHQQRFSADQISQVVQTILLSDEFLGTWGEKIKRPFEIAVSTMRATRTQFSFSLAENECDDMLWQYDQAGQPLFSWRAPNGYSDLREDWQSATPRVMSWRLCNWLLDVENDNDIHYSNVLAQTPADVRTAQEIADFWIIRVLGRPMSPSDRLEIVEFMAQGHNPNFDLPLGNDWDTQERLRSMVALICMSPTFLWR